MPKVVHGVEHEKTLALLNVLGLHKRYEELQTP